MDTVFKFFGCSAFILLAACASQQQPAPVAAKPTPSELTEQRIIQINKEIVLEKSSTEKPEWVFGEPSFEKDGYLYFLSEGSDSEGYALASRISKAGAAQELVETVSLKVKSELTKSAQRHGINVSGSFIQDAVAMTSQAVTIQDFSTSQTYKEKVTNQKDGQIKYKVYALYRIPLSEYQMAKARALEQLQGRAAKIQDVQAEQTAKILLNDLKQGG